MADERTTLVTLRKRLAEKTGCNEQDAGNYLNRLFVSIANGLKEDGQVRITGFGLFKVQWTAPRRSVNIQTGEPIQLEGYNKVVFVPDNALKERINEPFAHLEAVVIEGKDTPEPVANPMQKLDEQAAEIKDILAELGAVTAPVTPAEEIPLQQTEAYLPSDVAEEPVRAVETPITEETVTEAPVTKEPVIEQIVIEKPAAEKPVTKPAAPQPQPRPFHPWMAAGITMLVFCLLLTGGYFFLQHKITSWADNMLNKTAPQAMQDTLSATEEQIMPFNISDTATAQEQPIVPATAVDTAMQPRLLPPAEYTAFIATETLTEGSRLTWLARKYYGAFEFWVYIYEANKDILPDPNRISVGTRIRIPELPPQLIDTQNEESMQLARQLHNEILGQ